MEDRLVHQSHRMVRARPYSPHTVRRRARHQSQRRCGARQGRSFLSATADQSAQSAHSGRLDTPRACRNGRFRKSSLQHLKLIALIPGLLFAMQLVAAEPATDSVSVFVRAEMERQHIPGLTLLVSKNGEPIRTEGYGLSNLELNVPARPETIFQSGSVGKQFTATAVMMLVEAGKVGLDDPLTKYFPDAPASWRQVTVRELLSHTAGFTDYPKNFDERKDYTEEEFLKIVEAI